MKILVMGPSGAGKTYTAAALQEKGVNAFDADLIAQLSGWYDSEGNQVTYPEDADKEFLNNHRFLWDRTCLEKFLAMHDELYLFGIAGNAFDMLDLFDKVYFLKATPQILAERLRHKNRENPMGKTDYQLQNALKWGTRVEEKAARLGIEMIDASLTPERIFQIITNGQRQTDLTRYTNPMEPIRRSERFSIVKRAKSFTHAGRGIVIFLRTTHNAWIHIFILILAVLLGIYFHISYIDWMLLIFAAGMVLAAEAVNTAIEIDIDLTSPEYHPFARDTKDVAAGAVLIASLTAAVIGLSIFGHYFIELVKQYY